MQDKKQPGFLKRFFISFTRLGLKKEIYTFVENFAVLLSSGMDVATVFEVIAEESESKRMKKIIRRLKTEVEGGASLASSLEELRILPSHMLAFIRLGEDSGKLTDNLKVLVLQNEKEVSFKSKIRSALMYAVIVFSLTILVALGTSWYTLPRIAEVYGQLGSDLPIVTKIIISLGLFLAKYGYIAVPLGVLLLVITFYFLFSFPKTKFIGHLLLARIPGVKKIIKEVEIARFSYLFGIMLDAGLPIGEALKATPQITTFNNYKKFYIHLYTQIEQGKSFQEAMASYSKVRSLLPASVRQMIIAAEKSGTLADTFLRVGKMYEAKVEVTAKNLPIIMEPILLLIIGFFVAMFVLGTIMPIYNLVNII